MKEEFQKWWNEQAEKRTVIDFSPLGEQDPLKRELRVNIPGLSLDYEAIAWLAWQAAYKVK